jgi:uncharacterized protein YodC (DUF2158 family)
MPKLIEIGKRYFSGDGGERYSCSNKQQSGLIQKRWYNDGAVSRRTGPQTPTAPP